MRSAKRFFAILMIVAFGVSVVFAIGCFVSIVDGTYGGEYLKYQYVDDDDPFGYLLVIERQAANNIYYLAEIIFLVFGLLFIVAAIVFLSLSVKSFLELKSMPKTQKSRFKANSEEIEYIYTLYKQGLISTEEYERRIKMYM